MPKQWPPTDRANPTLAAIERHQAPLLLYARHLLNDAEACQDVVQETFCRLIANPPRALADPDAEGQLAGWLYAVCRNLAMDWRRKERKMIPLTETAARSQPTQQTSPSEKTQQAETSRLILHAITQLPEAQQEVVRLKFQHEMSYRRIAEITGKSVTNVGVTLHHAVKTIRRQLAIE